MTFKTKNLVGAYIVPGSPHILFPEKNKGYGTINQAMKGVAQELKDRGVERIIYYSTQWLSVLGLSFQSRAKVAGRHVDENWHDLGDLVYEFNVDTPFTAKLSQNAAAQGFQTSLVDYDHFPIDTATIVADTLINPEHTPTCMIASHVYSDYAATEKLCRQLSEEIASDNKKTAIVGVSYLTTNFHAKFIDLSDDTLDQDSDRWNQKILGACEAGNFDDLRRVLPEVAGATRTDMGLKAFAFIDGMCGTLVKPAHVKAYAALYGAGGSVISFQG